MHDFILPKNPMEELENNKKAAEQGLGPKEMYDQKKAEKDRERQRKNVKDKTVRGGRKMGKGIIYAVIAVVAIGGIGWLFTFIPNLPPTSQQNHSENSPPAHILTTAIPDSIQRHMLEHADGSDANGPGIIIQYNCDDYECEAEMVEQLTVLVSGYPDNVYLAPNNYDGKSILTRLGKREVLDEFDQEIIKNFIER